eukprot:5805091-Lingulodinium_polyedra.AAC.1
MRRAETLRRTETPATTQRHRETHRDPAQMYRDTWTPKQRRRHADSHNGAQNTTIHWRGHADVQTRRHVDAQ